MAVKLRSQGRIQVRGVGVPVAVVLSGAGPRVRLPVAAG